jgi:glycosyltransferase involved in cell wall biosynthesis
VKPAGVDVIVPCYNYGHYLRRCVASVLRERRIPIRVLIIDDASDDGSAAEAREIAAKDERVEFIVHGVNQGHIATFNEGIGWVRADYMLLLSADDMVAPGALARAVGLMESHPDVAFVHGRAVRFSHEDELDHLRESVDADGAAIFRGVDFIGDLCARPVNPVETATVVVRSSIQKRIGGYRPQLLHSGDLEMWLRCAAHGNVGVIGAVQGYVRLHANNMRDRYKGPADYQQRYEAFVDFFDHNSAVVANARQLKRQALRALAHQLVRDASNALDNGRRCAWMIELARKIWPGVRWTRSYWRLALKRIVAPLLARDVEGSPKPADTGPAR